MVLVRRAGFAFFFFFFRFFPTVAMSTVEYVPSSASSQCQLFPGIDVRSLASFLNSGTAVCGVQTLSLFHNRSCSVSGAASTRSLLRRFVIVFNIGIFELCSFSRTIFFHGSDLELVCE
jgi:hypothetical protein